MIEDAGRNFVLLAESEETAAVDEVQRLPASEFVAVRAIAGRGDHDPFGGALVLRGAPQPRTWVGWTVRVYSLAWTMNLPPVMGCGS